MDGEGFFGLPPLTGETKHPPLTWTFPIEPVSRQRRPDVPAAVDDWLCRPVGVPAARVLMETGCEMPEPPRQPSV